MEKNKSWNQNPRLEQNPQEVKVLVKEAEDEFPGFHDIYKVKPTFVGIDVEGKYFWVKDPAMKLPPRNN